jgi:transposase
LLPKITKETLDDWIKSLPVQTQIKVKWFSTDMNKWYKNSLKNILWNPDFSVDKYHLFQEANRVVDDVRQLNLWLVRMNLVKIEDVVKYWKSPKKLTKKDILKIQKWQKDNVRMKKYKEKSEMRLKVEQFKDTIIKNKKWEIVEYSEITQEYYEEKWYKRLFLTREKNLTSFQKIRLNQIFRDFDYHWYLVESWNIKEDFMNAIDEKKYQKSWWNYSWM